MYILFCYVFTFEDVVHNRNKIIFIMYHLREINDSVGRFVLTGAFYPHFLNVYSI